MREATIVKEEERGNLEGGEAGHIEKARGEKGERLVCGLVIRERENAESLRKKRRMRKY